ncbi:two-component sensor histidine kinase [Pilimelia anulata]|uniref:histidine kinase n=1 Tax=Pilimelia anulata TaxID=53371 RepID=A0A8J3F9G2_9ACTN|nr:HAMP domain-containing sensor histidine kinase [Pilimelia anulata]GGJ96955.1 two-component sensor histidine kinase [Pilimelia anulata]
MSADEEEPTLDLRAAPAPAAARAGARCRCPGRGFLRPWRQWTLRSRLILVTSVMAALALVVADTAGLVLLRSYLTAKIDRQLIGLSRPYARGADPESGVVTGGGHRRMAKRLGPDQALIVFGPDGRRETRHGWITGASQPRVESFETLLARARTKTPYTVPATDGQTEWRLLAVPVGNTGGLVLVGVALDEVKQTSERLLFIDIGVTVTVLLLLGLVGGAVIRLGLRPLTRMGETAAEITRGDLARRVDDDDPHTEAGQLGAALNSMLTRIEAEIAARRASEERLRRFVADASHELRTPLTSIRGFAELYRRGGAPPGPVLDDTMSRIEQEATRMAALAEEMLLLARLDQRRALQRAPVDLLQVAADTVRDAHARSPGRSVKLAALTDDAATIEPVTIPGDEPGLRQVAANLVANALQHTADSVPVTVRVGRQSRGWPGPAPQASAPGAVALAGPCAVLEVTDTGAGVADAHAERLFERFYRADSSRARGIKGGGTGLGLAIVAAIVNAHGGRVELHRPEDGGATFRVLLPTSPSGG